MAMAKDETLQRTLRWPDSVVLADDDFTDDANLHGWEQLYSGTYNGMLSWDRGAMVLSTENLTNQIATAIKRLSYWQSFTSLRFEAWLSLAPWYTVNGNGDPKVRSVEIGFDQSDNAGNRSYYALRRVFTESDGTTFADRFEVKTGTDAVPSYTPLPGQGYPVVPVTGADAAPVSDGSGTKFPVWPPNEGKRNRVYMALEVDPVSGHYLGAQFNSRKLGTLAASGTPALTSLSGQTSSLPRFGNGLNAAIDLRGVTGGATKAAADLPVYRTRVSAR
jgi:hypothetical protein